MNVRVAKQLSVPRKNVAVWAVKSKLNSLPSALSKMIPVRIVPATQAVWLRSHWRSDCNTVDVAAYRNADCSGHPNTVNVKLDAGRGAEPQQLCRYLTSLGGSSTFMFQNLLGHSGADIAVSYTYSPLFLQWGECDIARHYNGNQHAEL